MKKFDLMSYRLYGKEWKINFKGKYKPLPYGAETPFSLSTS
jgi:hypothetical protein